MSMIIYALGAGRYPAIFDSSGSSITNKKEFWPAAHFGKIGTTVVRPVKDDFMPYTKAELDEFVSFDYGIDDDWDTGTIPKIRTTSGFSIQEVTEIMVEADPDNGIEEESTTWAQVVFSVDYGTDEAKTLIQGKPSIELGAELNGFREGETRPGLIINFPHLLLGRRLESGTGTPNPVGDGTYSSAQIDALLRAGYELQFSIDGETSWHDTQDDADRYWHYRYPDGVWSDVIKMITGAPGVDGTGFVNRGAYDSGTTYIINDSVTHNGSMFASVVDDNIGNDPSADDGSNWQLMVSKGEPGEDAPEVQHQYSVDGVTDWHDDYAAGDEYFSVSTDGGTTFGDAMLFKGIPGTGYNDQGDYSSETTYTENDTVTYEGSLYFSLSNNNTDHTPNSSPLYWRLLVSKGENGNTILSGLVDPTNEGTDGDHCLNLVSGEFFKKEAGEWVSKITSIIAIDGEDGANGNTWFFTSGAPSAGLGNDGDKALDKVNWNVYEKGAGSWTLQGNIKGDVGNDGTGITPKGEWSSVIDYVTNDAVSYEGSLWRAVQASLNQSPPSLPTTSNAYWDILVSIGNPGGDGDPGGNAPQVQIEFSVDGEVGSWDSTYTAGDKYVRFSVDGGSNWTQAIKFVGNDGESGGITEAQAEEIAEEMAIIFG